MPIPKVVGTAGQNQAWETTQQDRTLIPSLLIAYGMKKQGGREGGRGGEGREGGREGEGGEGVRDQKLDSGKAWELQKRN